MRSGLRLAFGLDLLLKLLDRVWLRRLGLAHAVSVDAAAKKGAPTRNIHGHERFFIDVNIHLTIVAGEFTLGGEGRLLGREAAEDKAIAQFAIADTDHGVVQLLHLGGDDAAAIFVATAVIGLAQSQFFRAHQDFT